MAENRVEIEIALGLGGINSDIAKLENELGNVEAQVAVGVDDASLSGLASGADEAAAAVQGVGSAADQAASGVAGVGDAAGKAAGGLGSAAQEAQQLEDQFAGLNKTVLGFASGAITGLFGRGLSDIFGNSIDSAAQYERVIGTLESQLERTGRASQFSVQEIDKFAGDLGDATLTSRDAVLEAARTLSSFKSIQGDTFFEAITISQDLAEVLGSDLKGNILQVAKALEDPTRGLTALGRAGTTFTVQQKEQIAALQESGDLLGAQTLILEELRAQYGGAGVAAAQGLAGATDTLGENLNDLEKILGGLVQGPLTDLTNTFTGVIKSFVEADPATQKLIIGIGATTATLLTATGALITFNALNIKKVTTDQFAILVEQAKAVATKTSTAATLVASNVQAAYAVATGQATAAQQAQIASLGKVAATAGLTAGAIASISLAVAVYRDTTEAAREVAASTADVKASYQDLLDVQAQVAGSSEEVAAAQEVSAAANRQAVEEGIAGYNKILDAIRGVFIAVQDFSFGILIDPLIAQLEKIPGIGQKVANVLQGIRDGLTFDTAAEAAVTSTQLEFSKLVESTFDVQDAALALAGKINKGIEVDPAIANQTVKSLEANIAALEAQRPVTEADIALRDGQIAQLEKLKGTISEATGATGDLTAATAEQVSAVDAVNERIQASANDSALALAQSNERIQKELAAGVISTEEAAKQTAAAEKQALEQRILATKDAIAQIKAAQVSATDPEETAALNDQLKDLELDLAESRADLAKSSAEERVNADKAAAEERVAAEEAAAAQIEEIIAGIGSKADEKIAGIENAAKAEEAALLALQLSGAKSASEVQAQLSQIAAEGTQDRLAIREQELAELNAKVEQGVISERDAAERVKALTAEVGDLRVSAINDAIAAQQALEQAELERIAKVVSAQEQQAQLAQQEATIQIKQEVASNPGVASAEQVEAQLNAIAQQGVEERLRIKLAEFDAVREAQAKGLLTAESANTRLTELQFEINGLREESADAQIAATERVKEAQVAAIQEQIDLQKQLSDAVLERISIEEQQLSTQGRQAQAALGAEQAVAALETEKLKTKLAQAEASENETAAARLKEQIFKSTVEQQRLELEGKQQALELEAQQLALKQQSAAISAQIAVLEAEAALATAQAEGASDGQLAALQNVIGLREQQLALTNEQAQAEAQILADQQKRLNAEADIAAEQAKQAAINQDLSKGAQSRAAGLASVSGDAAAVFNDALANAPNLDNELRNVSRGAVAQAGQPQPQGGQAVTNQNGGNVFNFQTADPVADAAQLTNAMQKSQARAAAAPGGGCGGCC